MTIIVLLTAFVTKVDDFSLVHRLSSRKVDIQLQNSKPKVLEEQTGLSVSILKTIYYCFAFGFDTVPEFSAGVHPDEHGAARPTVHNDISIYSE
jgi:hypothetical protein